MHSMQAGYMEKAQKYTDKALMQIEKLKSMLNFVQNVIHLKESVFKKLFCYRKHSNNQHLLTTSGWNLKCFSQLLKKVFW